MSDVVNRNSKLSQDAQRGSAGTSPVGAAIGTASTAMGAYGAVMGFTGNVAEAAVVPVLSKLTFMQGIACLPASSHLDPVLGIDVHFVIIPPSPAPIPMPHPYIAIVMDPKDWISCAVMSVAAMAAPVATGDADKDGAAQLAFGVATMALALLGMGATVKLGPFTPRTVAGVANLVIPHFPMGVSFAPVPVLKNSGHAQFGSLFLSADTNPFTGLLHLNNDCWDIGIMQLMRRAYPTEPMHLYLPTGFILAIPSHNVIVNPIPTPINPIAGLTRLFNMGLGKLLQRGIGKLPAGSRLSNALSKSVCHVTGHPVDVASGMLFTDEEDFSLPGPLPLHWIRTWYSDSTYEGPLGHGWHHDYDMGYFTDAADGRIILRLNDGRLAGFETPAPGRFTYNRAEKLTLHSHPTEKHKWFTDEYGLIYRFTDRTYPVGNRQAHLLQSISDTNGYAIRLEYDRKGRLVTITDSAGRILTVENDRDGRITAIYAPHPQLKDQVFAIARYDYDEDGNMTRQTDALEQPMSYEYKGRLLSRETWRNGMLWYFIFDGSTPGARCIHTWGDGRLYDHELTYLDGRTRVENSLGHTTVYSIHDGLIESKTDANGATWEYRYNRFHELEWLVDPLGNQQGYTHDQWGNVVTTTDPAGGFTYTEYYHPKFPHLPMERMDAAGGKWKWDYDERGNLIQRTNPLGATTEFEYTDGLLSSVIETAGAVTVMEYDADHNLTAYREDNGALSSYTYDRLGNCTTLINPNGRVRRQSFDLKGRLTRMNELDGNIRWFEYDGIDNLVHYRDDEKDVHYTYKGLWKLTSRTEAGSTIYWNYDTEQRLRKIVNEVGQAHTLDRDPAGNIVRDMSFDGVTYRYERNSAGWVTRLHRPGGKTTQYQHDSCGRVTTLLHSDGASEKYSYRSDGRLMKAENETATVTFRYDAAGNILKETAGEEWVASTYDVVGNKVGLTSSRGADITQRFDKMGEVAEISAGDWRAEFSFDLLGLETDRRLPGINSRWQRDGLGRPLAHMVGARSKRYTWGHHQQLQQIRDERGITHFEHNTRNDLSKTVYPDGEVQLRNPDAAGNLYRSSNRQDRTYARGGRLKKAGGWEYSYDEEGRMLEKKHVDGRTWYYEWNSAGRLIKVTRPDGAEVSFAYDALGRRLWKKFKNTITKFVWDGNTILHEWKEHVLSGVLLDEAATTWVYETNSFAPAARIKGDKRYSVVTDHLGTPAQLYKEDGELFWEGELDSYGKLRMEKGAPGSCPFRYQGQYEDAETGLYYNRFRYYNPDEGLYISPDPIGLAGGPSPYGYVNDPCGLIDPLGLDPYDPIQALEDRGFTGVTKTPGGGLNFAGSNALHPTNPIQQITYTGDYVKDFEAASQQALGQKSTPKGYVWHHLDDYDAATNKGTMQLVKKEAHLGISHKGGVNQYEKATGKKYTFPLRKTQPQTAYKK